MSVTLLAEKLAKERIHLHLLHFFGSLHDFRRRDVHDRGQHGLDDRRVTGLAGPFVDVSQLESGWGICGFVGGCGLRSIGRLLDGMGKTQAGDPQYQAEGERSGS